MIQLGIIGPGLIWELTHRDIIARLEDRFTVVSVAARSEKSQSTGRQFYPRARIYSDAELLIADPAVEAVAIFTPIALNAVFARKALEAGKHVILEKPLARSVAEARELRTLLGSHTHTLFILEQFVHKSLLKSLKRYISSGEIGVPVSFERSAHCRIADSAEDQTGGFGSTHWRQTPDFPLGNFFDGGIHEVALLSQLFGPARSVFARGRSLRDGFGDVDLISMNLAYDGDVQGSFVHSAILGKQKNIFIIRGTEASLYCTDQKVIRCDSETGIEIVDNFPQENENVLMWKEAADCIERKGSATYSIECAIEDIALLEAVEKSIQTGTVQAMHAL